MPSLPRKRPTPVRRSAVSFLPKAIRPAIGRWKFTSTASWRGPSSSKSSNKPQLDRAMGLDTVELVLSVEKLFGIEIPDAAAAELDTVGKLHQFILAELARL